VRRADCRWAWSRRNLLSSLCPAPPASHQTDLPGPPALGALLFGSPPSFSRGWAFCICVLLRPSPHHQALRYSARRVSSMRSSTGAGETQVRSGIHGPAISRPDARLSHQAAKIADDEESSRARNDVRKGPGIGFSRTERGDLARPPARRWDLETVQDVPGGPQDQAVYRPPAFARAPQVPRRALLVPSTRFQVGPPTGRATDVTDVIGYTFNLVASHPPPPHLEPLAERFATAAATFDRWARGVLVALTRKEPSN